MRLLVELFSVLKGAVEEGVFPGAVLGISVKGERYIIGAGYKSLTPFLEPIEETDVFDLASLTKPLGLTFALMYLLEKSPLLDLEAPLGRYIEIDTPLKDVPVYRLLNHTSGLKAWYPFYEELLQHPLERRRSLLIKRIFSLPLEYSPGEKSLYSDLGFYVMEHLVELIWGQRLEEAFSKAKSVIPFSKKSFFDFKPLKKGLDQEKVAPTSVCPWNRILLRGIVEDENTRSLGGVSGAAGLFGNIYGVLDVLEFLIDCYKARSQKLSQNTIFQFMHHRDPVSDYALGFMLPSEKEKELLKGKVTDFALRHTGFTGTSFFIDPEKELIIVLLSNRVHPDRSNVKIREFRPYLHSKVLELVN